MNTTPPRDFPQFVNLGSTTVVLEYNHDIWDQIPESNPSQRKIVTLPPVVVDFSKGKVSTPLLLQLKVLIESRNQQTSEELTASVIKTANAIDTLDPGLQLKYQPQLVTTEKGQYGETFVNIAFVPQLKSDDVAERMRTLLGNIRSQSGNGYGQPSVIDSELITAMNGYGPPVSD